MDEAEMDVYLDSIYQAGLADLKENLTHREIYESSDPLLLIKEDSS